MNFTIVLNAAAISLACLLCLSDHGEHRWLPDTQCQRGGRVQFQNTAQQIRLHAVLLFWLKTDLRALNCGNFSRGKCSHTSLDPTWLRTHSSFSPSNLKYLPPPLSLKQIPCKYTMNYPWQMWVRICGRETDNLWGKILLKTLRKWLVPGVALGEVGHIYPARACAKGLSNSFCPSVSLSVCQFVSLSVWWKNFKSEYRQV